MISLLKELLYCCYLPSIKLPSNHSKVPSQYILDLIPQEYLPLQNLLHQKLSVDPTSLIYCSHYKRSGKHDKGDDASTTMVTMLAHWGQQCHSNNGNNASTTRETKSVHWGQRNLPNGNSIIATMTTMPVQQSGWQCQHDNVRTPSQWWQQRQQNDGNNASKTRATTPAQQWVRCLCNNSNGTIVRMTMRPAQWLQQCHCNDGKEASATMFPLHQLQSMTHCCHHCTLLLFAGPTATLPIILQQLSQSSSLLSWLPPPPYPFPMADCCVSGGQGLTLSTLLLPHG